MKTLLLILFQIPMLLFAQKRIVLNVGKDSIIYCTDVMKMYKPQAGDTLVIPDAYIKAVKLEKICASDNMPVVITQANPSRSFGGYGSYAFALNKVCNVTVQNFFVDGKGVSNSLLAASQFQNLTIENFVLQNSSAMGLNCKTDYDATDTVHTVYPYINKNLIIRYGKIENTGTEGAYIGTSHLWNKDSAVAVPIMGCDVHDLSFKNTGWDGFQTSNVQGLKLHDIVIENYGTLNQSSQRNGILIGSAVTMADTAYNLVIKRGTGSTLQIMGRDSMYFKNISMTGTARTAGESGVFLDNRPEPFGLPPQQVTLEGITIDSANKAAIYNYNKDGTSLPMVVHNYTFTNVLQGIVDFTGGRFWNDTVIVPPVIVPPIDTPVVIVPPVVVDDTIRITGSYTLTKSNSIIKFTGTVAAKLTIPDKPAVGFSFVIQNTGKVNLAFNKRVYFLNGQYRLMIKPGETMWLEFRATKKYTRYYITKRVY